MTDLPRGKTGAAAIDTTPKDDSSAAQPRRSWSEWFTKYAVGICAILLAGLFAVTNSSTFLTVPNLQLVLGSNSVALILALGELAPLISGEFDLSIGYTLELSMVVTAVLSEHNFGPLESLLVVVIMGLAIGVVNALLITGLGVSSFIATLGIGTVLSAVSLELTNGAILIEGIPTSLINFAQGNAAGVPNILWPALVCFAAIWVLFERSVYGRRLLAVGLSRRASQLVGVPTRGIVATSFLLSGTLAAVAGWLELGRVGSASSGLGPSFLLPAFAACFLGATTIKPGRFNVLGTGIAVVLVAIGINGLALNGVAEWIEPLFDGGVLIVAVASARVVALTR